MSQDSSHFLNELPLWKLKQIASAYGVDVSGCRAKRDYVERLKGKRVTEEQARKALEESGRSQSEEAKEGQRLTTEIEEIAERPAEATELPAKDEVSVEKHIDQALTMKPGFFEVDSALEAAVNRMITGDFGEAIKINRETRLKCIDTFSNYQVYSAAISIRAADELLARIPDDRGRLDPNLRTAMAAAKRAFLNGSPRQREESLENLEALAAKTYTAFVANSESEENELRELLADYESFGTRTEEARRFLQIAASARQSFNLTQYRSYLVNAKSLAEQAKGMRAKEIENTFHIVRAAASEALELGALVPSFEAEMREARKAFDDGKLKHAVELLAAVERATDSAHLDKLRTERDLEAKQTERVKSTVIAYGPVLHEANSYGLDVREGMVHLENAKVALARRDVVSAAKYARRVRELATSVDKDLDEKRIEHGVIKHIEDAKCGKCGKQTLYEYPNAVQKCRECGHSFSIAPVPPPVEQVPRIQTNGEAAATVPVQAQQAPQQTYVQATDEKRRKGLFKW